MNAIRKILKREGNNLKITLPESFTAKQVELIILPYEEIDKKEHEQDTTAFRNELKRIFKNFKADISGFNFNREELYDRP